jgi:hypothetical protein
VKGVKQLGFRVGNWLSSEESSEVLRHAYGPSLRNKRDYAMLAMLFGCGFRRSELVDLEWCSPPGALTPGICGSEWLGAIPGDELVDGILVHTSGGRRTKAV